MANTAAPARKGLRARFTRKRPADAASVEDFGPEYYGKPPRPWPVVLLALPAYVAIWGGWVELGRMCGFGPVNLLPGIGDGLVVDLAITLPFGMEVYAAYAMSTWLSKKPVHPTARRFAMWSSIAALVLGSLGQVAYHLLVASGITVAPWQVVVVVACLPVAVVGMGAALAHLRTGHGPARPTAPPAPAAPEASPAVPVPAPAVELAPVPVVYSPAEPVPAPEPAPVIVDEAPELEPATAPRPARPATAATDPASPARVTRVGRTPRTRQEAIAARNALIYEWAKNPAISHRDIERETGIPKATVTRVLAAKKREDEAQEPQAPQVLAEPAERAFTGELLTV
ncbi:hypothetical protein H9623_19080 [Oerskovia sp. Sa1BUA8]|uniref:DUF2637 domain-containing protein n=1 Tax=Oerskovia douganii TaxID=2762210 RepID=A0A9D5UG09_9CELL|nr:hypothetical protein [Oerskovia douganii]MBE7702396.1 hypothetical protein [Oerskovia douganii]